MDDISARLSAAGVVPVIRTATEAAARRGVALLAEEGFDVFEITLTTPGALSIIKDLSSDPALLIGVGTALTADDGRRALAAGARFVVSPAFVPGLGAVCADAGAPLALGAATPSEALRAHEDGAAFVKVFPAKQLGGPGFVKALKSVFPEIAIMPTGGIGPADAPAYFDAGAVAVGMGGDLVNDAALCEERDEVVRDAARAVRAMLAGRS